MGQSVVGRITHMHMPWHGDWTKYGPRRAVSCRTYAVPYMRLLASLPIH